MKNIKDIRDIKVAVISAAGSFFGKVVESGFDGIDEGMSEVAKRAAATATALRR